MGQQEQAETKQVRGGQSTEDVSPKRSPKHRHKQLQNYLVSSHLVLWSPSISAGNSGPTLNSLGFSRYWGAI